MSKGFDLGGLLQQAKQLQERLTSVQDEIASRTAEGRAGGGMVTAVVNGRLEVLRVRTQRARIALGEREADGAEPRLVLHGDERLGERLRVLAVAAQDVERQSGGGLLTDAGQPRELLDQAGHRGRLGHARLTPGPGSGVRR